MRNSLLIVLLAVMPLHGWALEIANVYHAPKIFNPSKNQQVAIHFTLSSDAQLKLKIFDDRDLLIRKISLRRNSGAQKITWDGKDTAGKLVPSEAYRYTLEGVDSSGDRVEYDVSDITGAERVVAKNIAWDADNKVIRYQLSKPARVILRVGIQNRGPIMLSRLNWSARTAGIHTEVWDGMDGSGVVNLASHPKLEIAIDAYSLSDNSILVGPKNSAPQYIENIAWGEQRRVVKQERKKNMYAHAQQSAETRGELDVRLVLVGEFAKNSEGLPLVSGIVPIRLEVAAKDQSRLLARGFEPIFFLDGLYVHENEMGFLPVTWKWDTRKVNAGEHYVTGNIRSYEGNFGMATLKAYVVEQ